MMSEIDNDLIHTPKIKYKPTKTGKIALAIVTASLSVGLIAFILSVLSIIHGILLLIVIIISHIVTLIALLFLALDVMKFSRVNHVRENVDNKMVLCMVIGIIIGFIWGKIL